MSPPTHDEVDQVLRFLPLFASPDFVPGEVITGRAPDGSLLWPYFRYSPTMDDFVRVLHECRWYVRAYAATAVPCAERYFYQPELLGAADFDDIRRIFTAHLRQERFTDGHLAALATSGYLLAVLRRLHELRQQLAD